MWLFQAETKQMIHSAPQGGPSAQGISRMQLMPMCMAIEAVIKKCNHADEPSRWTMRVFHAVPELSAMFFEPLRHWRHIRKVFGKQKND